MDLSSLEQLSHIRNKLGLNISPWDTMPEDLLYLAFIPKGVPTTPVYNFKDNDMLEFIGDAILDVIVAQYLSQYYIGDYSCFLKQFVANTVLTCLMNKQSLCSPIVAVQNKACADRFEAIIGALYHHIYNSEYHHQSFETTAVWFNTNFNLNSTLQSIMSRGRSDCAGAIRSCSDKTIDRAMIDLVVEIQLDPETTQSLTNLREHINPLQYVSIGSDPDDFDVIALSSLPLDLLYLAFYHNSRSHHELNQAFIRKYGFDNNRTFIFLGQKVFKLLITLDFFNLVEKGISIDARYAHEIREHIISRQTIHNVMNTNKFRDIFRTRMNDIDLWYCIVGVIYYYLYRVRSERYAMNIMKVWLEVGVIWPDQLRPADWFIKTT